MTPESLTDEALGAQLRALRDHIEPIGASIDATVRPVRSTRPFPVLRVAMLVLVVVAAAVLVIAPARTAVADWLGIGSTTVDVDEKLPAPTASDPTATDPSAAPTDDSAAEIEVAAAAELGVAPLLPRHADLGDPAGWEIRAHEGGFRELVVDWVATDGPVRLTAWAEGAPIALRKIVTAEPVTADGLVTDGEPALWIDGPHIRDLGENSAWVDATLLWIRDGVEYRLSGPALTLDPAVELARSQS